MYGHPSRRNSSEEKASRLWLMPHPVALSKPSRPALDELEETASMERRGRLQGSMSGFPKRHAEEGGYVDELPGEQSSRGQAVPLQARISQENPWQKHS